MPKLNYGTVGGKGTSYSRLLTLHACPRKFQLENIFSLGIRENNVNFAYGHAVAAGVQQLVAEPNNLNLAVVSCAANWDLGLYEESIADKKSLWYAIRATETFYKLIQATPILKTYEIAMMTNMHGELIPAIEVEFCITMDDGYIYEGHIDLILYDKASNTYLILELKTTKFNNLNEAMYKNSNQALGYGVVLDSIARDINASSSYYVLYLVYKSGKMEFETMLFPKNKVKRAHFINSLLVDIEIAKMYAEIDYYPRHGESCYDFFKPCEFLDSCNLSDEALLRMASTTEDTFAEGAKYDFVYDMSQIQQDQLDTIEETIIAKDS